MKWPAWFYALQVILAFFIAAALLAFFGFVAIVTFSAAAIIALFLGLVGFLLMRRAGGAK